MPVAKKNRTHGTKWVTRLQAKAVLDARARRVLNISGDEFIAKWNAGEFRKMDSGDCPGVIELALLAPKTGKLRARSKQKRRNR